MNRMSERKWACSIKSLWRKEVCRASRWEVHMGSEQTPWHNHAGVLSVHSPRLPKEWITLSLEAQVTEAGYLIHSGSWRMTLRCHSEVLVGKKCHRATVTHRKCKRGQGRGNCRNGNSSASAHSTSPVKGAVDWGGPSGFPLFFCTS